MGPGGRQKKHPFRLIIVKKRRPSRRLSRRTRRIIQVILLVLMTAGLAIGVGALFSLIANWIDG